MGAEKASLTFMVGGEKDVYSRAKPLLEQLGKKIEVHWYDEGHFGGGVEQDIDQMEVMLKFAHRITR